MIQILLVLVMIFWKKIRLTQFQLLLLICFLEVKTGILFGDYYTILIIVSYLLCQCWWYKALNTPVAQWN